MTSHVMKHNKERIGVYIAAFILWIATGPYYFWWIPRASVFLYRVGIFVILWLVFYKHISIQNNKDKKIVFLFVLALLYYSFSSLFNGVTNTLGFICLLATFPLLTFLLSKQPYLYKVFNSFTIIYAISIVISLFAWVLVLTGRAPLLGMIDNISADRYYYHYPFIIIEQLDTKNFEDMIRFAGPYDEPGLIGTFSSMILYANGYNLKKKVNIICLLSGLCSLSFFFAIVTGFYYIVKIVHSKKIGLLIASISLVFIFFVSTMENELIYETFWKRFEYNEDEGKISGINRMSYAGDDYYNSLSFREFLFGGNVEKYKKVVGGSSSYKTVIVNNGAIFLVVYVMMLLTFANYRSRNMYSFVLFLFMLLGNTFQRPDIFGVVVFFLYACLANEIGTREYLVKKDHY